MRGCKLANSFSFEKCAKSISGTLISITKRVITIAKIPSEMSSTRCLLIVNFVKVSSRGGVRGI